MQVRITENFLANLARIETFLEEAGAGTAYGALLDNLSQNLIPHLASHPRMGKHFLERQAESSEAKQKIAEVMIAAGHSEIREVIRGDYLILYALHNDVINLLSIHHHRQLSFDLLSFWQQ
ncbi:MAG: type II toxin-antitoxin system RelE/ParE family toxin [Pseudomonadales bacterium]|nr:type II toxin-antitoxin system RelE/ParE family toxin [Pseudomonadales bacterium]